MKVKSIRTGTAGLVEVRYQSGERLVARLLPDDHGRWRIHEMWFDAGGPFSPSRLRDLDLGGLEEHVNRDPDFLAFYVDRPGPRFDELADEIFRTSPGRERTHEHKPPPSRRKRRPALSMPDRVDDTFLRDVVTAYRDCVDRKIRPAPAIAAEVGVSERTVHGWIRKARERGMLPPGRQGAAG